MTLQNCFGSVGFGDTENASPYPVDVKTRGIDYPICAEPLSSLPKENSSLITCHDPVAMLRHREARRFAGTQDLRQFRKCGHFPRGSGKTGQ